MKLLAVETELKLIEDEVNTGLLKEEAAIVLNLHNNGFIKEISFSDPLVTRVTSLLAASILNLDCEKTN